METWRRHSSLCPFKRGATGGGGAFFIIGSGADTFLGCEGFSPEFPQTSPKSVLCNFFLQSFSTKIITTFFGVTSKKVFIRFSANLGRRCLKSSTLGTIYTRIIRDVAKIFSKSKLLSVHLHPQPPPPTPQLFITASYVYWWLIKIDVKDGYCSFSSIQKIQDDFLSFLLLFLRSVSLVNRNKHSR